MSNILQTRAEFSATAAIAERTQQSPRAPWMVSSMFIDDYKSPSKSLYPEEAGNCTDIFFQVYEVVVKVAIAFA